MVIRLCFVIYGKIFNGRKSMDNNAFFRKVTLEICASLQIEIAMNRCLKVLSEYIPVNRMFLQIYETKLGAMRTIASADSDGGKQLNELTSMDSATQELIKNNFSNFKDGVATISSPETNPVAREMLRVHGIEGWSILQMFLLTESDRLGSIVLTAEGPDRYGAEHIDLLSLLKRPFTIALYNTLEHREVLRLRDQLSDDNRFLNRELIRISGSQIIGADFGLKTVMNMVHQVASGDSPVLITGETGVGKDVIAGAIHTESPRRNGPFIAVNCGAIPESLVDSELFGHEKGAFTGALSRKRGRFERANGGTIFLDEIGEMPMSAQVRLLRVLQNREIERIGGVERIPLDIRIIAASNRNLADLIIKGHFREDLWYRLNVFPIEVPPLRDRPSDIPALVQHFIEQISQELKLEKIPTLTPGAIENLSSYRWPGNVRELANVIERSMILCKGGRLSFNLTGPSELSKTAETVPQENNSFPNLTQIEEQHIRKALERTGGKIHGTGGAGELLAINPNTLRNRMKKLGIQFAKGEYQ
jgi:transcriptional regulator with GAF, ATPase, and Fis domain